MKSKGTILLAFQHWVVVNNIDFVSRIVLRRLVDPLLDGNAYPLFSKMRQLEIDECYTLAAMFYSLFIELEINDWYLKFRDDD